MTYIENINIINFRCYTNKEWLFSPHINIIIGDNATGKTSLVEAIYTICTGKSFRTAMDSQILKDGTDFYSIISKIKNDKSHTINLIYSKNAKKISRDGNLYKSLSEHVGYINIIVFCPDDLKLIKGEPKNRRRFLDINIGQINKVYLNTLIEYNKTLKERNEILKKLDNNPNNLTTQDNILLAVCAKILGEKGNYIIKERRKFIESINKHINDCVSAISNGKEESKITYLPNIIEDKLENMLLDRQQIDIYSGTTTVGPHRDDFEISLNNKDASVYGSQGQQKTLALAIKLGLAKKMRLDNKDAIVILDDVFGELDKNRQNDLLKLLQTDNQIFITTTTDSLLSQEILKESNIIYIEKN